MLFRSTNFENVLRSLNLLSGVLQWLVWSRNGPAVHHFTSLGCAVHHLTSLGTQKCIFKVCGPKRHPLTSSGAANAFNSFIKGVKMMICKGFVLFSKEIHVCVCVDQTNKNKIIDILLKKK